VVTIEEQQAMWGRSWVQGISGFIVVGDEALKLSKEVQVLGISGFTVVGDGVLKFSKELRQTWAAYDRV